jgi:hypothetical protein
VLTEQKWTDSYFIIRGKDGGIPAWHCILAPHNKCDDLKSQKVGGVINCTEFGCIIEYRDESGQIRSMSGWGTGPPQSLQTWAQEHYSMTIYIFLLFII